MSRYLSIIFLRNLLSKLSLLYLNLVENIQMFVNHILEESPLKVELPLPESGREYPDICQSYSWGISSQSWASAAHPLAPWRPSSAAASSTSSTSEWPVLLTILRRNSYNIFGKITFPNKRDGWIWEEHFLHSLTLF